MANSSYPHGGRIQVLVLIIFLHKSLAKNHVKGVDGGVAPNTYIAFVIIECLA